MVFSETERHGIMGEVGWTKAVPYRAHQYRGRRGHDKINMWWLSGDMTHRMPHRSAALHNDMSVVNPSKQEPHTKNAFPPPLLFFMQTEGRLHALHG